MKICCRCDEEKELTEFYNSSKNKDGKQSWCKLCANLSRWSSYNKERYSNDPTFRERHLAQSRAYYEKTKHRKYLKKYDITEEEYHDIISRDCEICGRNEGRMAIDHDHTTMKIRGRLCRYCNQGLGFLGDTKESLEKAVAYLTRHEVMKSKE